MKQKNNKNHNEDFSAIMVNEINDEMYEDFFNKFMYAVDLGQPIIPININSYGGSVHTCLGMIDLIESCNIPVMTFTTTIAMSSGAVLLASGTPGYRFASANSTVMIHDVSSGTWGKHVENKANLAYSERLKKQIFTILNRGCEKDAGYFENLLAKAQNSDLYLTATQAKKHKLIDKIAIPYLEHRMQPTLSIKC